ncbi:hypothetical protein D3C72_1797670 [compost metagenome]
MIGHVGNGLEGESARREAVFHQLPAAAAGLGRAQNQVVAGAGKGDVQHPSPLGLFQGRLPVLEDGVERRVAVLAQLEGHAPGRVEEHGTSLGPVAAGQIWHHHHRPLEALGGMDRHKRHGVPGLEQGPGVLGFGLDQPLQPPRDVKDVGGLALERAHQIQHAAPVREAAGRPGQVRDDGGVPAQPVREL